MGFETVSVMAESFKAKATMVTAKGMIGISVQLYFLLSNGRNVTLIEVLYAWRLFGFDTYSLSLSLVPQVRRGKGDIMEFHNSFSDLHRRIAPLINDPSSS
jgi:hypothetical protein